MGFNNICDCPNPPGGQAVCEPNQLAICRVKNGVAQMQCLNPPVISAPVGSPGWQLAMQNWVLSAVTGEHREPGRSLGPAELQLLIDGHRETRREIVTFSLPDDLRAAMSTRFVTA